MIVQIEIDTEGPEFWGSNARDQVAIMLMDVMVELKERNWTGGPFVDFPIKTKNARIVGSCRVKRKVESKLAGK
jgi:hypothetical protein